MGLGFEEDSIPSYNLWSDDSGKTVFDDMLINSGLFHFKGTADPTWNDWTIDGKTFRIMKFKSNDEIFFSIQIPHKYKEGSKLRPHLHWTPADRGNEESGNTVAWKLDYAFSNINDNFDSSGTVDLTDTCDGVDDKHQVSGTSSWIDVGGKISGMLIGRLYRDSGDTWSSTSASQSPGLLQFDFHIEIDAAGSRQEWVKKG